MAKLKEKKRLLLALSCIVVFIVIFSMALYSFTVKKGIPQVGAPQLITIGIYENNTTSNLIIWWVVASGVWEGEAWDNFNAYLLVNGTFYTNVTLPPGTVNNDDLIVTYIPVRGKIKLSIIHKEQSGTVGCSGTVEFY